MDPVRFSPDLTGLGEVKSLSDYEGSPLAGVGTQAPGISFSSVLGGMIDEAASLSQVADAKVHGLVTGTNDDVHGTMISMKEAEISMKLVGSIRSKVLEAFHELWRTNV